MANLDDIMSLLPQEKQDALKVAQMEGEEVARRSAELAREKGLVLSVQQDEDVFINVKALKAIIATSGMKVLLGTSGVDDFEKLLVGIGDVVRAAEVFVEA